MYYDNDSKALYLILLHKLIIFILGFIIYTMYLIIIESFESLLILFSEFRMSVKN